MADFVQNICDHGLETIEAWRNTYRQCFANACKHDGLPPDTTFAVFSDDNPIVPHFERAYRSYLDAIQDFRCLGYVGLRLDTRQIPTFKKPRRGKR